MWQRLLAWMSALAVLTLGGASFGGPLGPPPTCPGVALQPPDAAVERDASDAVVRSHQAVASTRFTVRYGSYFTYPDETEFFTTEYRVAFDRRAGRLRVDRPGYTLVCDGTDLLLVAEAIPGRHLRAPLNGPLVYERVLQVMPDLADPMPPALIMLLAEPPMAWLSGGQAQRAKPFNPKHAPDDARTHLRLPVQVGVAELAFDHETNLLDELVVLADHKQLAGSGLDDVRFHYEFMWQSVDEPLDDALFELDLEGSAEATTMAQLLAAPAQPQAAAPTLIGLSLPDMELARLAGEEPVNLLELDEGVLVVEFFATWTRPSVLDLPALQAFKSWAADEGHDVEVVTVAVGDKSKPLRQWLEALEQTAGTEINLPVLMDESMEAAMQLKLPTLPRTLVVVDGEIVDVFGGVKPTLLEDLKEKLPGWLEAVKDEE